MNNTHGNTAHAMEVAPFSRKGNDACSSVIRKRRR
jgi:hypothetical protein